MIDENTQAKILRDRLKDSLSILHPPKHQKLSEWAEENFVIVDGGSPGKYKLSVAPFQEEILDTLSDDSYNRVVIMAASQMVKTVSLMAYTLYCIDRDPAPIMIVQPTKSTADDFASSRLEPMLLANPTCSKYFQNMSDRHSGNTKRLKKFPGGYINIANAGSVSELASKPIRIVLADEVDRYSDTKEGDALSLAEKRASTFWNYKIVLVSTPTDELSRIHAEYKNSDRRIYEVPCPHCGSFQELKWSQVKWNPDKKLETWERAASAHYECEACRQPWTEGDRYKAIQNGKWVKTNPSHPVAGFHINAIASPFLKLEQLVMEHYAAMSDPQQRISFTNTRLAEVHKEITSEYNANLLFGRAERYDDQSIPNEIGLITAGADVQIDRIEVEVVGWGAGDESWSLGYHVFHGSTQSTEPYDQLAELLQKQYKRRDGVLMNINATCIDAGGEDSATQQTFLFANKHKALNIYPIKGKSGKGQLIFQGQAKRWKGKKFGRFYNVGVDTAKDRHFAFINVDQPGPGFMHFPENYPQAYFEGLVSEYKKPIKGQMKWVKKRNVPNEALDVRIYSMAARFSFHNVDIGNRAENLVSVKEKMDKKVEEKKKIEKEKKEEENLTPIQRRQRELLNKHKTENQQPSKGRRNISPGSGWISGLGKGGFG